jgi:hypothetical protein
LISRDFVKAFKMAQKLADNHGLARAHFLLGFFFATGFAGVVERNQPKVLLNKYADDFKSKNNNLSFI